MDKIKKPFDGQVILPAIRSMKDFDKMLKFPVRYGVFLDMHISMLPSVFDYARKHDRCMFLHIDLIQGLASDEFGSEYICQKIKPYGAMSTKSTVIKKVRQLGGVATQRTFIIDSNAMERSIQLIKKTDPNYVEVLPGVVPKVITRIAKETGKPVIAGGLIESIHEVEQAIDAGASCVTTSDVALWKHFLT
ncbi:glycerol-3-phosphate responsive antiterminator [Bacillaceae bacterium SIJ1]|uniref:glycerol-3-phosphate responsive antiterminator n=1 Tax=Litoribacterium kuwaitense TaxID=1398745 RepID=UPI0013EA3F6B|nr:glycerol-3-phosphate responsive antiterminator [Litoribacterium kuwaitense]NGP43833.1 glycerol-3-phosphate responsive antiterminator [Litoribacterium kuwaitense]